MLSAVRYILLWLAPARAQPQSVFSSPPSPFFFLLALVHLKLFILHLACFSSLQVSVLTSDIVKKKKNVCRFLHSHHLFSSLVPPAFTSLCVGVMLSGWQSVAVYISVCLHISPSVLNTYINFRHATSCTNRPAPLFTGCQHYFTSQLLETSGPISFSFPLAALGRRAADRHYFHYELNCWL